MLLMALAGGAIQLVPDGTLLLHLVVIVIMVALLNATLLKPINRILENREKRTKGRFAEAQSILQNVDERLREYEASLREARAEGYALLEEERVTLSREREREVAEVKREVAIRLNEQKEELRADAEQIKGKLAKDAGAIASKIARQILRREIG